MEATKKWLRDIFDGGFCKKGRYFTIAMQLIVVLALIAFSIETLPEKDLEVYKASLVVFKWLIVGIFGLEYFLRLWVSEKRWRFVFSMHGMIDLLAFLPFCFFYGDTLRGFRVFWVLRFARLLKLFRHSRAMVRYRRAFRMVREELMLFTVMTLIMLYLASVGIYYFEREAQPEAFKSVFHSMWWAVVTMTTLGYGDVTPVTLGGRIFTFGVLGIGLGVIAVPSGIVAAGIVDGARRRVAAKA